MQDNNGADQRRHRRRHRHTATRLIAAIQAAGGPVYHFRQINPVNNQDGGEPGGNIRVGFLFRTDRGLSFVDRPGRHGHRAVRPSGLPAGVRSSRSARAASIRPTPRSTTAASRWWASSPSTARPCSSSPTTSTPRAATSRCSAASSRRTLTGGAAPAAGPDRQRLRRGHPGPGRRRQRGGAGRHQRLRVLGRARDPEGRKS